MKGRPPEDYSLDEFLPELWARDSDGVTVTRTHNRRLDPFRKNGNAGEETRDDDAPERNGVDGHKGNPSLLWNPSREQWIVIWVCAMAAWLFWSAAYDGGYGILGRTALFGDKTDQRFGALAILIGVLLTWQLESRRQK